MCKVLSLAARRLVLISEEMCSEGTKEGTSLFWVGCNGNLRLARLLIQAVRL